MREMRMRRWLTAAMILGALAGCTPPDAARVAQAPVTDPYADTGDGGAVYSRNLNGGVAIGRVLPGTPTAEEFRGVAGDTVTFAADQAVLSPEGRAVVARQAAWLARNPGFTALVQGHADDPGTPEYNLALGARRAAAVQEYLIARGVDGSRVTTVSFGRERPTEACSTEACFARNRRAVTVVAPGLAS